MDVYVYRAALLCEDCGEKVKAALKAESKAPEDESDEYTFDSDDYPKGPYPDGGGESDSPQHCDGCGVFLENPLTEDGAEYVAEMLADFLLNGRGSAEVVREWARFYEASVKLY